MKAHVFCIKASASLQKWMLLLIIFLISSRAYSQCPIPASCSPGGPLSSNLVFGCGITNVSINTINRSSGLAVQGYQDVSCSAITSLLVGASYTLSVTTGANVPENVRVWIDLNNDGVFSNPGELVLSSNAAFSHSGTVILPLSTFKDSVLRMRVMAEVSGAPDAPASNLQPCYTPLYSQVEDYGIVALPNTQPPVANFSVSDTITCSGTVQFNDLSSNAPTSWNWDFGDGNTSTVQNPQHTYLPGGPFTVRLIVGNSSGTDTLTKSQLITFSNQIPTASSCTPTTLNYCCGYGILNFQFGGINRSSGNASEGYRNFTCGSVATITSGISASISITTGSLPQDTRIWLDYNNDGIFTPNELVYTALNQINPSGTITVSDSALLFNTPLRLRVISDFVGGLYTTCSGIVHGQAEDYTVVVLPNLLAPVAAFSVNGSGSCSPVAQFVNQSQNTVTSYFWDFGDGNTSTQENPTHTYAGPGNYTVKLRVTGPFGVDSIIVTNAFKFAGTPLASVCNPVTGSSGVNTGIYRVRFFTIDFSSPGATEGYQNRICDAVAEVTEGLSYSINVNTGPIFPENVKVWIDYNNDGVFNAGEVVFNSANSTLHSGSILIPNTAVKNQLLRMRIISSFNNLAANNTGCGTINFGQGEDYGIIVRSSSVPPVASFNTTDFNPCNGGVRFTNQSTGIVTQSIWNFGDGQTSTDANPTHYYTSPGLYSVILKVCNAFGCDSIIRVNYIQIDSITGPKYAACTPTATFVCCDVGISSVTIGNMVSTSGNASEGNRDFSCSRIVRDTAGRSIPVSILNGTFRNENLAIWIDLNDDGILDNTTERVFQSLNAFTHSGFITITGAVVQNKVLRMRIASVDALQGGNPGPCGPYQNGQSEDYGIFLINNPLPPLASFTVPSTLGCNGTVPFTNTSLRGPTSTLWTFGDGNSSTAFSPTHTYATAGNFMVKLVACNANGCDSVTNTVNVTSVGGPKAVNCQPQTTNTCCNIGITNINVGGLNFTSANATEGYRDRTCLTAFANVQLGTQINISLTVGTSFQEKVALWIDLNDNGQFETNERLFQAVGTGVISGNFTINQTAITGKKLRLRVGSNFNDGLPLDPCADVQQGQFEDYSVVIQPITNAPVVSFSVPNPVSCTGTFVFTSNTTNVPTSYLWYFGDGTTSTLANPTKTYTTTGTYSVALKACNSIGCDSVFVQDFVRYSTPCLPTYCLSRGHNNTLRYITSVDINGVVQTSAQDPQGYGNYTTQLIDIVRGNTLRLRIDGVSPLNQLSVVEVWIDLDRNGVFATTEKLVTRTGRNLFYAEIPIPGTATVGETRMRVRIKDNPPSTNACATNLTSAEVEDYAINITNPVGAPIADFTVSKRYACPSDVIAFTNKSQNRALNFNWSFGNGLNSTLENPTTAYPLPGSYDVRVIASSPFGSDTVVKPSLIQSFGSSPGLVGASCTPQVLSTCCGAGVIGVSLNTFNYSVPQVEAGYWNHTCGLIAEVLADSTYSFSVQLDTLQGQNLSVWIDWNNDGFFSATERVMNRINVTGLQTMNLTIPGATSPGDRRMRVSVDQVTELPVNGCGTINLGHALDFTIRRNIVSGLLSNTHINPSFELFPNPASHEVVLVFQKDQRIEFIEITDLTGKSIKTIDSDQYEPIKEYKLSIGDLSSGLYMITIKTKDGLERKKLVKE